MQHLVYLYGNTTAISLSKVPIAHSLLPLLLIGSERCVVIGPIHCLFTKLLIVTNSVKLKWLLITACMIISQNKSAQWCQYGKNNLLFVVLIQTEKPEKTAGTENIADGGQQRQSVELPKEENEIQGRQENLSDGAGPSRSSTAAETAWNLDDSRPLPQSASRPSVNMSASSFTSRKRSLEQTESQPLKKARALREYCNISPDGPSTFTDVPTSQMEISENNDSVDKKDVKCETDDDNVVLDETKSKTRAKPLTFNLAVVKLERITVQDSDPVSMEAHATEVSTSEMTGPSSSNCQVSMTSQTQCCVAVKVEEDKQSKEVEINKEETESDASTMEQSSSDVECKKEKGTEMNRSVKESMETERCNSADIVTKPSLSEGRDREKDGLSPMPEQTSMSSFLNTHLVPTLEPQERHDSLLKLMDATTQERDKFKMKAQSLTLELEKKEYTVNLLLKELMLRKELSHQSIQTDPVDEKDFKTLYLQAKQHIEQLTQTINELQKKKQEENIQILLDSLTIEKARCEQMQKDLDELRKNLEECRNEAASSANHVNRIKEEQETNERPVGEENIVTKAKLRELRSSVARLLVTFVPVLDPEQVNYDCEVIDEILNQVIQGISSSETTSI